MAVLEAIEPKPVPAGATRHFYGFDRYQFGDLSLPNGDGPFPLVIVIHGGFWKAKYSLNLMQPICTDLNQRGYATWNIEYRRVEADGVAGNAGGGWPGTLTDVGQAADFVRQLATTQPLDLGSITSLGHSAGGHLALWLAARHRLPTSTPVSTFDPLPLARAVSLAGANNLALMWQVRPTNSPVANFLGGTPEDLAERYSLASPHNWLPLGVPQILVHGDADEDVPIELSRNYYAAATQAGDQTILIELPSVDHFAVINPHSDAWAKTIKAMSNKQ